MPENSPGDRRLRCDAMLQAFAQAPAMTDTVQQLDDFADVPGCSSESYCHRLGCTAAAPVVVASVAARASAVSAFCEMLIGCFGESPSGAGVVLVAGAIFMATPRKWGSRPLVHTDHCHQ